MSTPSQKIAGRFGTFLVTGDALVTRNFDTIIGHEDAVISELYYTDDLTDNIIADLGLTGATIGLFETIYCQDYQPTDPEDRFAVSSQRTFGAIKLASGSVFVQ